MEWQWRTLFDEGWFYSIQATACEHYVVFASDCYETFQASMVSSILSPLVPLVRCADHLGYHDIGGDGSINILYVKICWLYHASELPEAVHTFMPSQQTC
jgi:hypothetical protein